MPTDNNPSPQSPKDGTGTPDEPLPSASDEKVLEESARLAREGRKALEADPKEQKQKRD
jgi:hypothetical protein